jgi:hypothetical protein
VNGHQAYDDKITTTNKKQREIFRVPESNFSFPSLHMTLESDRHNRHKLKKYNPSNDCLDTMDHDLKMQLYRTGSIADHSTGHNLFDLHNFSISD